MMGKKILASGRELYDGRALCCVQEILNKLVQAEPQNQAAKDLVASVFEQLGYQQANPGLRNSYLAGTYELRNGIPPGEIASSSSPDVVRAMPTELLLNFLGIRMDSYGGVRVHR
jgi:alkyl sulfatase BDS1-like metallo-beta-lactamase superfamily hydrolase